MQKASFLKNIEFSDKNVVINSMIDNDYSKEIRLVFQENQTMKKHKTKYPITVMILKGKIIFSVNDNPQTMEQGDIISLEGNILHELEAIEDSVVHLSLSKNDNINRVKNVL